MLDSSTVVAFAPTTDLDRAKAFFADVLGLALVHADGYAVEFDAHGTTLRVNAVPAFVPHPFTILGWEVDDIVSTVTALAGRGVAFQRYEGMGQDDLGIWTTPTGERVAWFLDPDGNNLSLTQPAVTSA